MKKITAFTLMEMTVIVVIMGILSLLAVTRYTGMREIQCDSEAQATIRLIANAERSFRTNDDADSYVGFNGAQPATLIALNAALRLNIPTANNRNWDYEVRVRPAAPAGATRFCVAAERVINGAGQNRWWSMVHDEADPVQNNQSCNRRAW